MVYFSSSSSCSTGDQKNGFLKDGCDTVLSGRLHFLKFETSKISECIKFISSKRLQQYGMCFFMINTFTYTKCESSYLSHVIHNFLPASLCSNLSVPMFFDLNRYILHLNVLHLFVLPHKAQNDNLHCGLSFISPCWEVGVSGKIGEGLAWKSSRNCLSDVVGDSDLFMSVQF